MVYWASRDALPDVAHKRRGIFGDPNKAIVDNAPQLRADTFVQRRQSFERRRRSLMRDHEDSREGRVAQTMLGMAKRLARRPRVESLLRVRKGELGLPAVPSRSVGQSLADLVGIGRSRGLGIGM
jgi:hypothetical protein